jgi:CHASE2 domain-containing sensor protein
VTHLAATLEAPMNDAVHQLLQLVLQAITWAFKTIEALWVWSWVQIAALFSLSWGDLAGWKLALGLIAAGILIAILVVLIVRGWERWRGSCSPSARPSSRCPSCSRWSSWRRSSHAASSGS